MYRRLVTVFVAFLLAWVAQAQLPDSIQFRAAMLAARGEVGELRPLYRAHRAQLLPQTRLYCELALARADGDKSTAVACIDTLVNDYAEQLDLNGRLALIELKASLLLRQGRYAEAKALCTKELSYFKRRKVGEARMQTLRNDLAKAVRLAPNTLRARMLGLADRDMAFELRPLYESCGDSLDAYARQRCALALARAFRQGEAAFCYADSLLAYHPDSLDASELTLCLRTQAEHLSMKGDWKGLRAFCDSYASFSPLHGVRLSYYRRMADAFSVHPATSVELPARDCSLPLSPRWPLFVPVRANGGDAVSFLLDTGQGHTLLPEAEARSRGMQVLSDTLYVASAAGVLSVSPALADSLELGGIVFRNLLVYAVHPDDRIDPLYTRVLGCNELLRLPGMTFYPEKIVFHRQPADRPSESGSLRLSADGSLLLHAVHGGLPHVFSLDTGSSADVFPSVVFPEEAADTLQFDLALADSTYRVSYPIYTETRAANHDGLLGVPFLRQFRQVEFDFSSMRLSLCGFDPEVLEACANAVFDEPGHFTLMRNTESLLWPMGDHDRMLYQLILQTEGYRLDSVLALCGRLEELDASFPGEPVFVGMARYLTQFCQGDDAGAVRTAETMCEGLAPSDTLYAKFSSTSAAYRAALQRPALRWRHSAEAVPAPYVQSDTAALTVVAQAGRRQVDANFILSNSDAAVSAKTARRLKIKTVYEDKNVRLGLLDSLRIGSCTLYNVRCRIRPGKEDLLQLSFACLFRVGCLELRPEGVSLCESPPQPVSGASPMRHDEGLLLVQEETPEGYSIRRYALPDLTALARQSGAVVLDCRRMLFSTASPQPSAQSR